jgi:hypothetical protein
MCHDNTAVAFSLLLSPFCLLLSPFSLLPSPFSLARIRSLRARKPES